MANGNFASVDLTVDRGDPSTRLKVQISTNYLRVNNLGSAATLYLERSATQGIPLNDEMEFCNSDGEALGDVYIGNDAGAGTLELFWANQLRISSPNPGSNSAQDRTRVMDAYVDVAPGGTFSTTGPAEASFGTDVIVGSGAGNTIQGYAGVEGVGARMLCSGAANGGASWKGGYPDFARYLIEKVALAYAGTLESENVPENISMRAEYVARAKNLTVTTQGVACFCAGLFDGFSTLSGVPLVVNLPGFGFAAIAGETNWHTVAGDGTSGVGFGYSKDTGVPYEERAELVIEFGFENGSPFLDFSIDGTRVDSISTALITEIAGNAVGTPMPWKVSLLTNGTGDVPTGEAYVDNVAGAQLTIIRGSR